MTLEEKIIFLENDVEKLNLAIYSQEKKLKDLEKTLQILHKNINSNNAKQSDDLPPHY